MSITTRRAEQVDQYVTRLFVPDDDALSAAPRVSATVIQTVGQKGYDGFALALVLADA